MWRKKIIKGVVEVPQELFRFVHRNYPAFVTEDNPTPSLSEVPVIMFHSVKADRFESQLAFLSQNGYQSLSLERFFAFQRGERRLNAPSVLLTFDDGDRSWNQTAYPLLQKYGFHAVGFVVPHYLRDGSSTAESPWLTWDEVAGLDKSGVFDIQSHSYRHERTFSGPKLVDFYHPDFSTDALGMDVPWTEIAGRFTNDLEWGTPLYQNAPRLLGRLRYIDDAEIRQACVSFVRNRGNTTFFREDRHWKRTLLRVYRRYDNSKISAQYESPQRQRSGMLETLARSREVLERRLNKPVRHLCYPWGGGSEMAIHLSREAGFVSNFWVISNRRTNRSGDDPFRIPRIKDDYIFRLPGEGRKPIQEIFLEKLKRRMRTTTIY